MERLNKWLEWIRYPFVTLSIVFLTIIFLEEQMNQIEAMIKNIISSSVEYQYMFFGVWSTLTYYVKGLFAFLSTFSFCAIIYVYYVLFKEIMLAQVKIFSNTEKRPGKYTKKPIV
ncbi:hypothetical protein AM501_09830 [Aneurinibacillus migulanus]|uniref:hypothetical protein n=1 Tax=Aneurinibacillus migulanus TaxID=47500 RepID=UPI0005B96F35|nr:hypothetical protein [Aneurinibacillus migulanus]KIV56444.1 hypothetical protein TS64_09245 [Aneurinibacillus migulanus]KPD08452.1 hypothetical protein AM501_09830 [Aneurinibacillus migulanus]